MRSPVLLAIAGIGCAVGLPAAASPCGEQIQALDARLTDAGEMAVARSSGGQAVAAEREGQALQPGPASTSSVPAPAGDDAALKAAKAGRAGDAVMQAKAALSRARTFDQKGDASACEQALEEAKRLAAPGP